MPSVGSHLTIDELMYAYNIVRSQNASIADIQRALEVISEYIDPNGLESDRKDYNNLFLLMGA